MLPMIVKSNNLVKMPEEFWIISNCPWLVFALQNWKVRINFYVFTKFNCTRLKTISMCEFILFLSEILIISIQNSLCQTYRLLACMNLWTIKSGPSENSEADFCTSETSKNLPPLWWIYCFLSIHKKITLLYSCTNDEKLIIYAQPNFTSNIA